jgi:hypothetical protein
MLPPLDPDRLVSALLYAAYVAAAIVIICF